MALRKGRWSTPEDSCDDANDDDDDDQVDMEDDDTDAQGNELPCRRSEIDGRGKYRNQSGRSAGASRN